MQSTSELPDKCNDTIAVLLDKYKDNEYILQRLDYHINTGLETTLHTEAQNHEQRLIRANNLANEQAMFVKVFLSKHRYYYLMQNNLGCFYAYDGKHYRVVKEDDILHKLLNTISHDSGLQDWKYKTKNNIIKQIKETTLLKAVPESATIQYVLKCLSPKVFPTRDAAKYFLTLLGDNILKKNRDNIYLIYGKAKNFLTQIDSYAYITMGQTNITRNFIKYHESHAYNNCRLLSINDNMEDTISIDQSLDMFCVACHYSNRFTSADDYIARKAGETLKDYTLYLKNNSRDVIIDTFCSEMLDNTECSTGNLPIYTLKWKDMHYLWKSFLLNLNLPNMIYFNTLKTILVERYEYSEIQDCFINITSKHLPRICEFIEFWEKHVHSDAGNELEIDEICNLIKVRGMQMDDIEVLKVINHFFSEEEIIDNRYIANISCDLWNKSDDIADALNKLKESCREKGDTSFLSFEEAYNFYCDTFSAKQVLSKGYFEKYLRTTAGHYIEYETFLHSNWYTQTEN